MKKMSENNLTIKPVTGAFGAEIVGVSSPGNVSDEDISFINQAFLKHRVLFFRNLSLSPAEQTRFGQNFGELEDYPFVAPLPGSPKIIPVIKEPEERINFGGGWHSDLIYKYEPPSGTMLYAVETPQKGGDTLFADGVLAYNNLSEGMKKLLGSLSVVYSVKHVTRSMVTRNDGRAERNRSMPGQSDNEIRNAEPVHPLDRTHPETGEKCLYFSRGHTIQFDGMTPSESAPLLDWLAQYTTQPVFTTRFSWQPTSMVYWDNRCIQHYALNDYHGERRHMHRLTLAGDKPV